MKNLRNGRTVVTVLLILVCLGVSTVITIWIAGRIYRWYNPYLDRNIAGPTTIDSTWMEFEPEAPLKVERQIYQVALELDGSIKKEPGAWGIMLPDGSIVKMEVQLVGDDGITYDLDSPSFFFAYTGETLVKFSRRDLPRDRTFVKVRIRTDQPINCRRIFWRNYNQWDVEGLL